MEKIQEKMKKTYETTIDNNIDKLKDMHQNGLTEEDDILLLDTCLKYVIFMSEIRNKK